MLGFLFGNYSGMYGPIGPIYPQPFQKSPGSPSAEVIALQQRVDSLELACAGLWKLLKETSGLTDEQLLGAIHEVDAADGAVDGRITRGGGTCPHCGHRLLSRTASKCLWCGAPLAEGPFNQSGNESSPLR